MTEQPIPKSKPELLSAIEHEWNLLMDVIARLDSANKMETADAGGWSPKDNLAHLMEWMKILMGYHMDKRPNYEVLGVSPEITKDWDMETINPVLFERNHGRPVNDVLNELKQVHGQLISKLESTPFEDLMKPRHADDPEKTPLLNWVLGNTTEHFAEHRLTIEKLLE